MVKQVMTEAEAVPALQGRDPRDRSRGFRDIQSAAQSAAQLGLDIRDQGRRMQLDEADTNTVMEFNEKMRPLEGREYATAAELREYGIDEDWMYETVAGPEGSETLDREEIPAWEFMPGLTDKVMGDIIDARANDITWGSDRELWTNEKRRGLSNTVARLNIAAEQGRWKDGLKRADDALEAHIMAGEDLLAMQKAWSYPDPALVDEKVAYAKEKLALNKYNEVLQSRDPALMRAAAEDVINDTRLTEPQQTALQNSLLNTASSITNANAKERVKAWDYRIAEIDQMIEMNHPGATQAAIEFHSMLYSEGRADYVGKEWLSNKMSDIRKAQLEKLEADRQDAITWGAANQPGMVNRFMDNDAKESVDRVTEEHLANAMAMDAAFPDAQGSFIEDAYNDIGRIAVGNQYLPEHVRGLFRSINIGNIPWERASDALQLYNYIADKSPFTLSQMSEDERLALNWMRQASIAGQLDQDSYREYRQAMGNVRAEERDNRANYSKSQVDKGAPAEWFANQTDNHHPQLADGWLTWGGTPAGDKATLAFNTAYQKYYMMSGDEETALNSAYDYVWSTYGMTSINGSDEVWRDPPELRYNMSTEEIREDLEHWVQTNTDFDGEMENVGIVENVDTPYHDGKPQYSIVVQNEFGMPVNMTDPNGVHITWAPDVERIENNSFQAQYDKLQRERSYEEARERAILENQILTPKQQYDLRMMEPKAKMEERRQRYLERRENRRAEREAELTEEKATRQEFADFLSQQAEADRKVMQRLGLGDQ